MDIVYLLDRAFISHIQHRASLFEVHAQIVQRLLVRE